MWWNEYKLYVKIRTPFNFQNYFWGNCVSLSKCKCQHIQTLIFIIEGWFYENKWNTTLIPLYVRTHAWMLFVLHLCITKNSNYNKMISEPVMDFANTVVLRKHLVINIYIYKHIFFSLSLGNTCMLVFGLKPKTSRAHVIVYVSRGYCVSSTIKWKQFKCTVFGIGEKLRMRNFSVTQSDVAHGPQLARPCVQWCHQPENS